MIFGARLVQDWFKIPSRLVQAQTIFKQYKRLNHACLHRLVGMETNDFRTIFVAKIYLIATCLFSNSFLKHCKKRLFCKMSWDFFAWKVKLIWFLQEKVWNSCFIVAQLFHTFFGNNQEIKPFVLLNCTKPLPKCSIKPKSAHFGS